MRYDISKIMSHTLEHTDFDYFPGVGITAYGSTLNTLGLFETSKHMLSFARMHKDVHIMPADQKTWHDRQNEMTQHQDRSDSSRTSTVQTESETLGVAQTGKKGDSQTHKGKKGDNGTATELTGQAKNTWEALNVTWDTLLQNNYLVQYLKLFGEPKGDRQLIFQASRTRIKNLVNTIIAKEIHEPNYNFVITFSPPLPVTNYDALLDWLGNMDPKKYAEFVKACNRIDSTNTITNWQDARQVVTLDQARGAI